MTMLLQRPISRRIKVVLFAVVIAIVSSCSFKTLYNRLDYLIPTYVEGMVSLDSMLENKLEQRTLELISWHRNTQLDQYADWLQAFQQDANRQLTEDTVLQHIATLETFWQSLLLRVNEEMVILLPLLNAEQIEELFLNITDKNESFRENFVAIDNDERVEQYFDRLLDNYETWLGDLTDEQQRIIEQAASDMLSSAELRLQRRLSWQRGIQAILGRQESAKQKASHLREFLSDFNIQQHPEMRNIEAGNKLVLARLTMNIVHGMTDEQKLHFDDITSDYIRMFNELAEVR